MEHRPLSVAALLSLALVTGLAGNVRAEPAGPSAEQQADWEARLGKAKELQTAGREKREAAAQAMDAEKLACQKKFRVYDCHAEAQQRYVTAAREGRRLENEGSALERQVKKEQQADKDQRRRDEAPQRAADLQQRQAETAAEREVAEARREQRQADKEQKAAEGEKRRAAEAERRRLKQDKHERKVAEKMDKAKRREAEQAAAGKD